MTKKSITVETDASTPESVKQVLDNAAKKAEDKCVSDVIPGGQFYPDLPRTDLADIAEVTQSLLDAVVIEDFEGDYGIHDLALMLIEDLITGEQSTTACSGIVVVKKVKKLIDLKAFPILATFLKQKRYWDVI